MSPRHLTLSRIASALIFGVVMALCALLTRAALGRPPSTSDQLAELLARVSAHEGAIQNPRDLELVWQVVQNNATTTAKRLAFLAAHCPQVAGERECRENCWAVSITGGVLPAGVAAGEQGYWKRVVLPRYAALERRARQLVAGAKYVRPCDGNPTTWGSPVLDHDRAVRLGMRQHVCRGVLNEGWSWP